jgi:predicted nucleic acid-binding protein
MNLAYFVPDVEKIPNIIKADRFDNIFLAMAQTHHANLITSGDRHLLKLKQYRSIEIVTPSEAVQVIENVWKA